MKSIERILGDWFGLGNKDQQILKIIASMDGNEQAAFLSRLTDGKDPLLPKLLKKVDGPEKLSMFLFLQTMFLLSGMNVEDGGSCPTVYHDPANYKHFNASLKEGKVQVTQFEQTMVNGDVRQTAEWDLPPFASVSYTLRDKSYTVPAFFLTDQETLSAAIGEETLLSVIWGAMQGEFNENPTGKQILADIGINFIPIVGQICDARDIAACLDKLINQGRVSEVMVWIALILTAIGCIPYAGDVVKGALKAIVKGADDVAIVLVRKVGGDNAAIAIKIVASKFDEALPEIRRMIQGWAEEAAKKGSPNTAQFFSKMDEMISAAAKEIRTKIDDFGRKVGGETDDIIHDGSQFMSEFQLKPNIKYETNGYLYETDSLGRIKKAEGQLTLQKGTRNKVHQKKAGGDDRIPGKDGDHGGHLIGTRFNGSPLIVNIVAMNGKNVNLSDYKILENSWENALLDVPPKKVVVNIKPIYNSTSQRPVSFKIEYSINDKKYNAYLANQ
jgi:hypothetical protein